MRYAGISGTGLAKTMGIWSPEEAIIGYLCNREERHQRTVINGTTIKQRKERETQDL